MMMVAAAGVLMNGAIAGLLWKFSGDVNIRSVFLHMLGDTLSTAAVIAGGAGILFTGHAVDRPRPLAHHRRHDPLVSSSGIVRETLNILLEGTPRNVSLADVRAAMAAVAGVVGRPRPPRLEPRLQLPRARQPRHHRSRRCRQCRRLLRHPRQASTTPCGTSFHIPHTTIQFETQGCETTHGCSAPPELEAVGAHAHHHHGHDHHHHGHSH